MTRRFPLAALLVGICLGAAACGSSSHTSPPVAQPSTATRTTTATSPTSTAQSKRPAHTGTTTAHSTTTAAAPTPTPQQVSKAKQALSQCQKENPGVTLKELEREAAGSHGIQC